MWVDYLTEILPGLAISLGCLLLWWQAHVDLLSLKKEWNTKFSKLTSSLSKAASWDEASAILRNYAGDSDA